MRHTPALQDMKWPLNLHRLDSSRGRGYNAPIRMQAGNDMITVLRVASGRRNFARLGGSGDPHERSIGNTGDDIDLHGLHISPDLDIVITPGRPAHADQDGIRGYLHALEMSGAMVIQPGSTSAIMTGHAYSSQRTTAPWLVAVGHHG
jgi:hypothetical protein